MDRRLIPQHTLELSGIQVGFGQRRVLTDVYLKVHTGEIIGIVGRNGQGKSSLMQAAYGTLAAEKHVRYDECVLQDPYKFPSLLRYLPQFNFLPASLRISRVFAEFEIDPERFSLRFPELQLAARQRIGDLSGGWRRVIETYVILCSRTEFVLLDEPFTHLSPLHTGVMQQVIREESATKGIVLTDHLVHELIAVSTSLHMLKDGALKPANGPDDLAALGYRLG